MIHNIGTLYVFLHGGTEVAFNLVFGSCDEQCGGISEFLNVSLSVLEHVLGCNPRQSAEQLSESIHACHTNVKPFIGCVSPDVP